MKNVEEITVITDEVYAMGKAVAVILNVTKKKEQLKDKLQSVENFEVIER